MRKTAKISLWIIGTILVLVIAAFLSADIIVSHLVRKKVAQSFENIPDAEASVGGIYLDFISSTSMVKDISFRTKNISLSIPALIVRDIRYWELLRYRRLVIQRIDIEDAQTELYLDEKHPEDLLPSFPKDTMLYKAHLWLQTAEVRSLNIHNFRTRLRSTRSALDVAADSLTFSTKNLNYRFRDSVFCYTDSVYSLHLNALHVVLPDSSLAIELHNLHTENQGPLTLGYTRLRHLYPLKYMVHKAKEPTTWIDLEIQSLSTSALNPLRKTLAMDYTLDSVYADVKRMHVCQDLQFNPKQPVVAPQDFLRKLPIRFQIKQIEALARKVDVELFITNTNCGQMHLKDIRATLTNVTNLPGANWFNRIKAPFGKEGKVEASYTMHFDKNATFEVVLDAKNVETSDLDRFIRPLVGITSRCHIDHLQTQYTGDRKKAHGEFCMQYTGLEIKVHKEDRIPYAVVTKLAKTITRLANALIPESNPTSVDPAPRRYEVEWKRDERAVYPLYLFGPCIDGVKKTILPGLYVHKQVRAK